MLYYDIQVSANLHRPIKVEVLCFKSLIVFIENLVSGTFICADNESKLKEIGRRLRFWDTGVTKTTYFLSQSHGLPHKVIQEVRQIHINVLQKAKKTSFIFLVLSILTLKWSRPSALPLGVNGGPYGP